MTGPTELAKRFGTPSYVYDLERVAAARDDLFAALPDEIDLFYAAKANPHPELLRELRSGGTRACRAEISSVGELDAVLQAGFRGEEILYTGPGKTAEELAEAMSLGVRLFSVESPGDLRRVGAVACGLDVTADCLVRVNNATGAAATSIRMTGVPSQFGFDSETLPGLAAELRDVPGTRVAGLHFFPLSNAKDEASLIAEFRHTVATAAALQDALGVPFRLLDIGGGFAAPYAVQGGRPVYGELREALAATLDEHFPGWRGGAPRVACESGRYLVADSGTLLTSVVNVKDSRGQRYLVLDAGINTFGGMSGLGRIMPVSVEPHESVAADGAPASLAGPLCTPGDLLGRNVPLPDLAPGELLTVPNAGSYGPTASLLMFLGRPAPAEVVVRGDDLVSVSRIQHIRTYEHGQAL
ncbi:type III PLP-dependent enzyme [Streptomyces minutiscleroticus]|uniref:Diaminopimelate decarboxylase n=1 Tax=Streptomyces minutiscleroticus TaxID=68238 RepID=A0A918NYU0_9ACTN|nr:type III PLP-dependent enzyme [Streptomyces minutiscleroticus]GGY07084.1 diaminopimelate decarboxylase [Streptomyces minutiscleroticus]